MELVHVASAYDSLIVGPCGAVVASEQSLSYSLSTPLDHLHSDSTFVEGRAVHQGIVADCPSSRSKVDRSVVDVDRKMGKT